MHHLPSREKEIKILNGNELLIQGALEAGFHLYTGYPGSPLADYFNILHTRQQEFQQKGIQVVIANAESHAAAMAGGAKMAGKHSLIAMKSMGLHVASDALSVGQFANSSPIGKNQDGNDLWPGVVIVVGDDPWSMSTSTPADSRYLFQHLHIPVLMPSSPQEGKDCIKLALKLSQESSLYVGVLMTTAMAEGGARIFCDEEVDVRASAQTQWIRPEQFNLRQQVMVPPHSLYADQEMIQHRFPRFHQAMKSMKTKQDCWGNKQSSILMISCGHATQMLLHVLQELQLMDDVLVWSPLCVYPLDEDRLRCLAQGKHHIVVIEEKRDFLETAVKSLLLLQTQNDDLFKGTIWGKTSPGLTSPSSQMEMSSCLLPAHGGLNFEILETYIIHLWSQITKKMFPFTFLPTKDSSFSQFMSQYRKLSLPIRYPTFCPGCPHRETLSLLKEIRKELQQKNIPLLTHGDVGCYSLSFLPPFKEMHDLSAMGQGGALGSGTDLFAKNPSVVLMGDSTFYHSGMTTISHSVQMNHTITYILLDNDNTAMTGHQVTPATGENIQGQKRPKQKMLEVVRSLGVQDCIEVQPSDRYFYKNVLWELMEKPGTKVVVSTKECALTFQSRLKKEERLQFQKNHVIPSKTFYQINTDACEDCRECVEMTGCPGLTQTFDAYGTKVSIDPFICVSDSYCTTMKACPSFEKIDVFDYHPTLHLQQSSQEQSIPIQLPQPTIKHSFHDIAAGKAWRVVVTGVGGSGITTISRLLAEAAKDMEQREDVSFQFFDQKGLAQRNGSVIGFLSFFKKDQAHCLMLPYHSAHLILSTDHYEGLRSLNYLSEEGTAIIDEQAQSPLSILLDKAEDQDPWREEEFIKWFHEQASIGMKQVQIHPMKDKAAKLFGKTVYASTFCLGVAFQQGLLPFSESSLLQAIKQTIPKSEQKNNEEAFYQGRLYALSFLEKKNHFDEHLQKKQNRSLVEDDQQKWMVSLKASFHKGHDFFFPKKEKKIMEAYREDCQMMGRLFPHVNINSLYQYVHDFYLYGHGDQQKKWRLDLQQLAISYPEENVQTLALRLFVKTYFIKDEVFVAHLLSSPHKEKKDRDMYQHLGSTFQVAHINRPRFDFGWFSWEFDWESRPWMLKIMKHQRWLRRILPHWHKREKHLALWIRHQLLKEIPTLSLEEKNKALRKIEQIKGYREKRWALWNEYFPKTELKFVNQNEKVL